MGKNYILSAEGQIMALVEIVDLSKFDEAGFIADSEKNGFKVQKISDTQKMILVPKEVGLN